MFVAVVLLAVATAGCTWSPAPTAELSYQAFNCADPIDILDEPPDGWLPVLDVIALPDDSILEWGSLDDEVGRTFSKVGLVIRADEPLTMSIADASLPNAVMGWNDGSTAPGVAIEIPGCSGTCATDHQPNCPLGESGKWIVYPGGVWTIEPACVQIEIAAGKRSTTAELPIGVECSQN